MGKRKNKKHVAEPTEEPKELTAGEYMELAPSIDEEEEQPNWNEEQNAREVTTGKQVEAGSQSSSKKGFTLKIDMKDTPSNRSSSKKNIMKNASGHEEKDLIGLSGHKPDTNFKEEEVEDGWRLPDPEGFWEMLWIVTKLSVGPIVSMIFYMLVQLINTYYIGHVNDSELIAGVGMGNMLINVLAFAIMQGLNGALETLIS